MTGGAVLVDVVLVDSYGGKDERRLEGIQSRRFTTWRLATFA